ncbi:hypothetical protein [Mucilaginibacter sp. UYCu711]|uniref:hypothetical protein n=1 Tax=Mucilaginibacter sp. UYCu711 TaxID=3156339 RepID=UPI003D1CD125
MKKLFVLLLLGLPFMVKAQMAVIDVTPSNYLYHSKSIAAQVQQALDMMKSNATLATIGQTLYNSQKIASQMFNMQSEVKQQLLAVSQIANLKWSNMNTLYSAAQGISLNYGNLIPNPNQGMPGRLLQSGATSGESAKSVFYSFNGRDQQNLTQPAVTTNLQQSQNTRLQLDDASSIRKLQVADFYDKTADNLAEKSVELSASIKTDSQFSMTHAERLSLLKQCGDLMIQSADLRVKADALRKEAVTPTATQSEKIRQQRQQLLYKEYQSMKTSSN